MRIDQAIEEYLGCKRNSVTKTTYQYYVYHLDRFYVWCKGHKLTNLSQIRAPHVQDAVSAYQTSSSVSKHGYARVIKTFLKWCSLDEDMGVKELTVRRIEMPKKELSEVRIFSQEDIDKLFAACSRTSYPLRSSAILHMLLDTGVRASELCYDSSRPEEETGLRMEHVHLGKRAYIRVIGKGRKARSIGLGRHTRLALERYLNRERGESNCPYVFLSRDGEPMSMRMLEQFIDGLGEMAGVEPCYPHLFRHTFAVNHLLSGTSDLVLMRLLGHTSLEATKVYVRAMSEIQAMKTAPSIVDLMRQPKRKE
jgi:site-specific recombinase XerD